MFGISSRLRQKRQDKEAIYNEIAVEIENGKQHKGLWTQALEKSEFNEDKARATYLRLRYQSIIDERASTPIIAQSPIIRKNEKFSQAETARAIPKPELCEACGAEITVQENNASFLNFLLYSRATRAVFWLLLGYAQFEIILWLILGQVPFGVGFLVFPIMPIYHAITGLSWADNFLLVAIRIVPFFFSLYCYFRALIAIKRTHSKLRYLMACKTCAEKNSL